jgi:hypothetical protein
MAHTRFVIAITLVVAVAASRPPSQAQQPPAIPLVVEHVQVVPPLGGGHSQLAITVRSTATRVIDAWGVSGEMKYADGFTQHLGTGVDSYERPFLPVSHQPPDDHRVPPGGVVTLTTTPAYTPGRLTPVSATASVAFVIFDDDTAVGRESSIEGRFRQRRLHAQLWEIADTLLTSARAQGLGVEQTFRVLLEALGTGERQASDSLVTQMIRGVSRFPSEVALQRLRADASTRRAAAEAHSQRRR